jgi:ketosteroid isomerase-like protein
VSTEDNVRTVEAIYAAFGRGDLGALLNTLAEDVVWPPREVLGGSGPSSGGLDRLASVLIARLSS